MLRTDLEVAQQNAAHRIEFILAYEKLVASDYAKLCRNYQVLAICHLLQRADRARFGRNLSRCALARLAMLEAEARTPSAESEDICLSRDAGFWAALALADFETAKRIVALSPTAPFEDCEYPDDFYFPRFNHLLLVEPDAAAPRATLLEAWETLLDGAPSGQLDVCKGLETREADQFVAGLESYLATRAEELEVERERLATDKREFAALGRISVEAIGLVRLAESLGMPCPGDFPLVPSSARVSLGDFVPLETWRGLD